MVFTSIPLYLDPPPNWHQQQNQQQGGDENPQLPPPPQPQGQATGLGMAAGSIRPGSMADRARLAKIPQPEAALKCPRCDSTNTKFCYFNNYSLSQPRHFCKTCRRYWTRGGALRTVPVGGGCRRNKRSKGSSSKSPAPTSASPNPGNPSSNTSGSDGLGQLPPPPHPQFPFMSNLHHLGDHNYGAADIGLSFGGIQPSVGEDMEFNMGAGSSGGVGSNMLTSGSVEQWRLPAQVQQFPFLTGLEPAPAIYPFDGNHQGVETAANYNTPKPPSTSNVISQMAPVKMDDNQGLSMSRTFLGMPGQDQYWGGNAWTDLTGFSSSSTSHML